MQRFSCCWRIAALRFDINSAIIAYFTLILLKIQKDYPN